MKTIFHGLSGSGKAYHLLKKITEGRHLVILPSNTELNELCSDLKCLGYSDFIKLENWDILPLEQLEPSAEIVTERVYAISNLNTTRVIITTAQALIQKIVPPKYLIENSFKINLNDKIDKKILHEKLITIGYTQAEVVDDFSQFALRGKIIDIYPTAYSHPVRIELDEDKIISIRNFNLSDQRSTQNIKEINILPTSERINPFNNSYKGFNIDYISKIKNYLEEQKLPQKLLEDLQKVWKLDLNYPGLQWINYILYPCKSIFEYIDNKTNLIIFDEHIIRNKLNLLYKDFQDRLESESLIPHFTDVYLEYDDFFNKINNYSTDYFSGLVLNIEIDKTIKIKQSTNSDLVAALESQTEKKTFTKIINVFSSWIKDNYRIVCFINSQSRIQRLIESLKAHDIYAEHHELSFNLWKNSANSTFTIIQGSLSKGAKILDEKLILVSEDEVFSSRSFRKSLKPTNVTRLINKLSQLQINNYIVHQDYGIGIYLGMKNIAIDGNKSDFIEIQYADSKIYLPLQNIKRIEKYNASEGNIPVLDRLSSSKWRQTKEKVKANLMNIAAELIKLYAARSIQKGWRFDPSGALDEIFAEDFPYDETADQAKAIQDTLNDMCKEKPMDRLICGDVGFGKTEVAMRAAYKAVQHGKQVAVLVPTTILVDQHESTFKQRFSSYPIKIESLSRFNSAGKNKENIEQINNGNVDIIIGTHRLLSRNIAFKDLGLVIIDEEHRFGVKQKEKLKAIKKNVDVLTMTATPIPRTLHMSLSQIREISVIATPPAKRQVVKTYVAHSSKQIIRDAVLREIQRDGQVFILHNRVETISEFSAQIQEILPESRVAFAHGQMSEDQLENIMHQFIKHEYDVLIATAIIESGIDVPNANTIIIDRADKLGLAQLYQLRGRVGRSTKKAYCYLLIPDLASITENAQKRLEILQNIDELGQGFSLALQDLEIRGAGNLLGKEQSGNVSALGYEMYTKILQEAVYNLQGIELEVDDIIDPEVKINANAFISEEYIPDISQRLLLYQKLSSIRTEQDAAELRFEIEDRFGEIPEETEELIKLSQLRGLLKQLRIDKLEVKNESLFISFNQSANLDVAKLISLKDKIGLKPNNVIILKNISCKVSDIIGIYNIIDKLKEELQINYEIPSTPNQT